MAFGIQLWFRHLVSWWQGPRSWGLGAWPGRLSLEKVPVSSPEPCAFCLCFSPDRATMGTTAPGPVHLLELCDQKLMEFVCNVDNKHLVWLEEIEEEAKRMFTR